MTNYKTQSTNKMAYTIYITTLCVYILTPWENYNTSPPPPPLYNDLIHYHAGKKKKKKKIMQFVNHLFSGPKDKGVPGV